jgi:hypothetical protein
VLDTFVQVGFMAHARSINAETPTRAGAPSVGGGGLNDARSQQVVGTIVLADIMVEGSQLEPRLEHDCAAGLVSDCVSMRDAEQVVLEESIEVGKNPR